MDDRSIIEKCNNEYTMLSVHRRIQLIQCVEHVITNNIEGDFVEIGVWRGGAIMIMLYKLLQMGVKDRHVHLFDTFSGMTEASPEDVCKNGADAMNSDVFEEVKCVSPFDLTYKNVESVGYPMDLIHFHVGDIRKVKSDDVPPKIALLRLDNDWFELYKFELPIFEPKVPRFGVVIIDDYDWWNGCKKAVDEYLKTIGGRKLHQVEETVFWLSGV